MRDGRTKVKFRSIIRRRFRPGGPDVKVKIEEVAAAVPISFLGHGRDLKILWRISPAGGDMLLNMTANDLDLLRQFACDQSQAAFTALVHRHVNLVFSAARRQVRSPQLAEEIAQSVFADLARDAGKLKPDTILTAWLYQVTRRTAVDVIRKESRRQLREQTAVEMTEMNATADDWTHIEPLLDDAMAALDETDRSAILLRYFENKSLREVGTALGVGDDAAQKRVSRAVEQLRGFFSKRNATIGASGLVVLISANAVQSAPAGLAVTISATAVLTGTAVHTSTVIAATKTLAMTIIQKTLVTVTVAVLAGAGIYEAHQATQLRGQIQMLRQAQAPLAEPLARLQAENERLSNSVVQARDAQALSKAQFNELLKLRGQVAPAQANARELTKLKSTLAQQPAQMPDFFTNALATGLGTAEKWKLKDAQARLGRMKKMLNLTDAQAQAIGDTLQQHIQNQSQLTLALITGKFAPEQQKALGADHANEQAEIEAVFTPEQLAAYPDYLQAEKTTAADTSAKFEAGRIADDFSLTAAQQEQIHAAFYQITLNAPEAAVAAAKQSGDLAAVANLTEQMQRSELDEKLKILGTFLTPEQINTYREKEMNQINLQASAMKMFFSQKTAGTAN